MCYYVAGLGFLRNSNTFAIQNNSDNTSGSGVFLTQEGNVGVKMSSPQYALDINGEARLSGLRLFMNNYGVLYSDQNNMALFTDGGYVFGNKDNSKTRAIIESDGSLQQFDFHTKGIITKKINSIKAA